MQPSNEFEQADINCTLTSGQYGYVKFITQMRGACKVRVRSHTSIGWDPIQVIVTSMAAMVETLFIHHKTNNQPTFTVTVASWTYWQQVPVIETLNLFKMYNDITV